MIYTNVINPSETENLSFSSEDPKYYDKLSVCLFCENGALSQEGFCTPYSKDPFLDHCAIYELQLEKDGEYPFPDELSYVPKKKCKICRQQYRANRKGRCVKDESVKCSKVDQFGRCQECDPIIDNQGNDILIKPKMDIFGNSMCSYL